MRSRDPKHQHLLGVYQKCRISGPVPDLLNQNPHFNPDPGLILMHIKIWEARKHGLMVRGYSVLFLTSRQLNRLHRWGLKFPESSVVTHLLNTGSVKGSWLAIFVVGKGQVIH